MTSWYLHFPVCFGHDPGERTCGSAVPDDGGSDVHPVHHWEDTSKASVWPAERGCVESACSLINPEMLPLQLHGNTATGQKWLLPMSQDIYLIYTTVRGINGDFCDPYKNKEKFGIC